MAKRYTTGAGAQHRDTKQATMKENQRLRAQRETHENESE